MVRVLEPPVVCSEGCANALPCSGVSGWRGFVDAVLPPPNGLGVTSEQVSLGSFAATSTFRSALNLWVGCPASASSSTWLAITLAVLRSWRHWLRELRRSLAWALCSALWFALALVCRRLLGG